MKPINEMDYHPTAEKVVQILCNKTRNPSPNFFRVLVAYHFAVAASSMRVTIATHDRGDIPVNMYAINLGTSGSGKGYSNSIMEKKVMHRFRSRFMEETFEALAEQNLPKLALRRSNRKGTDPDAELLATKKEFDQLGPLFFSFDSATPAAVKQMRHKLLMAEAGSVNLQIDEIGSNLLGQSDVLVQFLELYDGTIKPKLVKNTVENARSEEIPGLTPTNMMLFGTPSKLQDGSKTEEEFNSFLETGYARRCIFGVSRLNKANKKRNARELYEMATDKTSDDYLDTLSKKLDALADMVNINRRLLMTEEVSMELIEYQLYCEDLAEAMPEHAQVKKAEMAHRYFKALKLAGVFAFIDDSPEVRMDHLHNAIRQVEDSGADFQEAILTRDRPHVKLAKFLGTCEMELTQADLMEDLPFFKGSKSQRDEMINLAIAHGYKNSIIIKKSFSDGIEFLRGESLKGTDLDKMILAYSMDMTEGYKNVEVPFTKLHKLTQKAGHHWVAHHLVNGYRNEENAIAGFNLLVLDVDEGVTLEMVRALFKDFKYLIYTTKRHTALSHRFRIILPTNYTLKMDKDEYKEFMKNVYESLPFKVDDQTNQRARKWLSHAGDEENPGHYEYNEGQVFDVLPFIPKTSKNEERVINLKSQSQLDNLERWFLNNIGDGNRNNQLLKYAMVLVDGGFPIDKVQEKVLNLNDKVADKLSDEEIYKTIFVSVAKAVAQRP